MFDLVFVQLNILSCEDGLIIPPLVVPAHKARVRDVFEFCHLTGMFVVLLNFWSRFDNFRLFDLDAQIYTLTFKIKVIKVNGR